jgi:hypothetical protein
MRYARGYLSAELGGGPGCALQLRLLGLELGEQLLQLWGDVCVIQAGRIVADLYGPVGGCQARKARCSGARTARRPAATGWICACWFLAPCGPADKPYCELALWCSSATHARTAPVGCARAACDVVVAAGGRMRQLTGTPEDVHFRYAIRLKMRRLSRFRHVLLFQSRNTHATDTDAAGRDKLGHACLLQSITHTLVELFARFAAIRATTCGLLNCSPLVSTSCREGTDGRCGENRRLPPPITCSVVEVCICLRAVGRHPTTRTARDARRERTMALSLNVVVHLHSDT